MDYVEADQFKPNVMEKFTDCLQQDLINIFGMGVFHGITQACPGDLFAIPSIGFIKGQEESLCTQLFHDTNEGWRLQRKGHI